MNSTEYEYLDCGDRRRLERVGGVLVSRIAPAAMNKPGLPDSTWYRAEVNFDRSTGWVGDPPKDWSVEIDGIRLELRPSSGGQIGVFPEHAQAVDKTLRFISERFQPDEQINALNLFAHTGLATLRLASRPGTSVTHIDSAKTAMKTAKKNAEMSGLEDRPIRWLLNDVTKFCKRECKRGTKFHVIIADPPSYGHGNRGEDWKIDRDLPELIDLFYGLLEPNGILCLTCHSEGWTRDKLRAMVRNSIGAAAHIESDELTLRSDGDGHPLYAGFAVYALLTQFDN